MLLGPVGRTPARARDTCGSRPLTNNSWQDNKYPLRTGKFEPRMIPPTAPRAGIADLMLVGAETPRFSGADTMP
ncbi:hypothetical protein [Kitasatospora cinereorecta]